MRLFSPLYDRVLRWAAHPQAERYLVALSFAESSFFPVPPDVMLAPMVLAQPARGWRLAFVTTLASVVGGAAGYALGWLAIESIEPWLVDWGYWEAYSRATVWFETWGVLAIFVAGFSPIPYTVFTISAGGLHMFLPFFLAASFIGRGARFFLVAGLLLWGGAAMERRLRENIDAVGWCCVGLIVLIVVALRLQS
jgi:membrane protein YqaA with SNARE-associated domain